MKYGEFTFGQAEALFNKLGGESAVRLILKEELVVVLQEGAKAKPEPKPLPLRLIPLPPIQISALDRFVIDDRIKVGVDETVYVSPEFRRDFDGMVEDALLPSTIYPYSNVRQARYAEIRKELGEGKTVKVGQIHHLVKSGGLFADGRANLFEVANKNGVPRLVFVYRGVWRGGLGWVWVSCSVDDQDQWDEGRQVFSGNPNKA